MKTIASYKNGSVNVVLKEDGTKYRFWKGTEFVIHPESVDVKITDYCDAGCPFCHEKSTKAGIHGDEEYILKNLLRLPRGVEIAIGGGNPLSHPNLLDILGSLKNKGLVANMTVNQLHIEKSLGFLKFLLDSRLIYGLGISLIPSLNGKGLKEVSDLSNNVVFHLINKVHTYEDFLNLKEKVCKPPKILILGYKDFGRGKNFKNKVFGLNKVLNDIFDNTETALFDNLAIEQLNLKNKFDEEVWNQRYMGDEFTTSMFFDGVKREFAPTSTSEKRYSSYKNIMDFWNDKENIKNDL